MNRAQNTLADMIACYYFGKLKTQLELRQAIKALAETDLFPFLSDGQLEAIARHNEARQGVLISMQASDFFE